jgi:protein-L-isoaspartate O-methyltransferase
VLEVGTGSGFVTACLAQLAREVVSVEQHATLAERARTRPPPRTCSKSTGCRTTATRCCRPPTPIAGIPTRAS